jgi:Zn-dependent protease with chaperone function
MMGTSNLAARGAVLAAFTLLMPAMARAQLPELPFKLPSFLQGGASAPQPDQPGARPPTQPVAPTAKGAAAAALAAAPAGVSGNPAALADLKPDITCSRPQEGFDVMAKLTAYGGENARLRLQRLVSTDFRYDDLTPQDRQMLKYIAYTTVWIPPSIESRLGGLYSSLTGEKGDESFSASARRSMERIELLKRQVPDFPGEIRLQVLRDMPNGASAQAGGLISIAQGFVSDLESQPSARDLILAHEMSHVYKRHALKEIQHQLVSSSAGFNIAKKLLGSSLSASAAGGGGSFLTEAFGSLTLGVELVNFVRNLQISFGRDQELEADACAAVWMRRASMSTADAWKAFETAAAAPGNAGDYFKQHPSSAERKARFMAAAQRQAPKPTPARAK